MNRYGFFDAIYENILDKVDVEEVDDEISDANAECDCEFIIYARNGNTYKCEPEYYYCTHGLYDLVENVLVENVKKRNILCYKKPEYVKNDNESGLCIRFGSKEYCTVDVLNQMIVKIIASLVNYFDMFLIDDWLNINLLKNNELLTIDKNYYEHYDGFCGSNSPYYVFRSIVKSFIVIGLMNSCGEDLYRVKFDNKMNLVTRDGIIVLDDWVDNCTFFSCGWCLVIRDETYNYVNKNGDYISSEWYKSANVFCNGRAVVRLNYETCGHIDTSGKMISGGWLVCGNYINGYASVKDEYGWTVLDYNGKELTSKRFCSCGWVYDGYSRVAIDEIENDGTKHRKYNYLDTKGNLLFDQNIIGLCGDFSDGLAKIDYIGSFGRTFFNYIRTNGKKLWKLDKDKLNTIYDDFSEGMAVVKEHFVQYYINENGERVSDNYDLCSKFTNGFGLVRDYDGNMNFIKKDGKPLLKVWCSYVQNFNDRGYAIISNSENLGMNTIIDSEGNKLSEVTFDVISFVSSVQAAEGYADCVAIVKKDDSYNCILADGTFLFNEWFGERLAIYKDGLFRIGYDRFVDRSGGVVTFI